MKYWFRGLRTKLNCQLSAFTLNILLEERYDDFAIEESKNSLHMTLKSLLSPQNI